MHRNTKKALGFPIELMFQVGLIVFSVEHQTVPWHPSWCAQVGTVIGIPAQQVAGSHTGKVEASMYFTKGPAFKIFIQGAVPVCAVQEPSCLWSSIGEHHCRRSTLLEQPFWLWLHRRFSLRVDPAQYPLTDSFGNSGGLFNGEIVR